MVTKFSKMRGTFDEEDSLGLLSQSLFSPRNSMIFQVFFLSQDNSQSVEVLETEEIDFGEIFQRLQIGESIFIQKKNLKADYSSNRIKEEQKDSWYFNRC